MFKYALSIASILIAAPVGADSDPKYTDANVILADLQELVTTTPAGLPPSPLGLKAAIR